MKKRLLLVFILIAATVSGNINFIRLDSIAENERFYDKYIYIKDNEPYISHWSPEWNYNISKQFLVEGLKGCFEVYSKCNNQNIEINLLLGDICHYLYNLDEREYYSKAVEYYKKAIDLAPYDYRPLWFLAYHYSLSNVPDKSVEYFIKSQKLLPANEPPEFWEEYCNSASIANMPSHCIYAMDRVKALLGRTGNFETQLGQVMRKRIDSVRIDTTYNFKDIWIYSKDSTSTFICRPFGIKLSVDPEWKICLYDYKNNHGCMIINPSGITNKKGKPINYTIALFIKLPKPNETLDDFIREIVSKYPDKKKLNICAKYPGQLSYEFFDNDMYKEIGGAHMDIIGLERNEPEYDGLILEQPMLVPQGNSGKIQYYRAANFKGRFKGKIQYIIMLDACEDIYEGAFKNFIDFFEKHIVIE